MTRGSRKLSHPAALAGPAVEPQAAEPQAAIARAAEPQAAEPRRFTFVMSGARGMQWSTLPRCQLCGRRMNSLHGNAVACSNLAFRTPLAARPLPHACLSRAPACRAAQPADASPNFSPCAGAAFRALVLRRHAQRRIQRTGPPGEQPRAANLALLSPLSPLSLHLLFLSPTRRAPALSTCISLCSTSRLTTSLALAGAPPLRKVQARLCVRRLHHRR